MKDTKLLDETLIDLLRLPESKRTSEIISGALALAASAAGIRLGEATDLQQQHMQLDGAVRRLTDALGDAFTYRTTLRLGPNLQGMELFASIDATSKANEIRFTGFGRTAQGVLQQLNKAIAVHGLALSKPTSKKHPSRDPLRMLPREARRA